ncbi:MAG: hypothetical protein IJ728_02560 [Selenomonadaceae bacterium]|nr:hypothetical protein [Selenomonadaceae bacterium]
MIVNSGIRRIYSCGVCQDIKLNGSGIIYTGSADSFFIERDTQLPMWGTMWSFSDSIDNYWLEQEDGFVKMSNCDKMILVLLKRQAVNFNLRFEVIAMGNCLL